MRCRRPTLSVSKISTIVRLCSRQALQFFPRAQLSSDVGDEGHPEELLEENDGCVSFSRGSSRHDRHAYIARTTPTASSTPPPRAPAPHAASSAPPRWRD
eukprot:9205926-Pyramimonas_sp.AAC.1